MSASVVSLQPVFILQNRPYRESSLLLEVFSRDFGIVTLLVRGVRKQKSRLAGLLLPFNLLHLSYLDKNELKILTHAEFIRGTPLQGLALYCGYYVNELVQLFCHKHDPHPDLFFCYQTCLQHLSTNENLEQGLRYFELQLLEESGYGIELNTERQGIKAVNVDERYHFLPGVGLVADKTGIISGATLLTLHAKAPISDSGLLEAKQLLRQMLEVHLQGKPLKSREVLRNIIRYL